MEKGDPSSSSNPLSPPRFRDPRSRIPPLLKCSDKKPLNHHQRSILPCPDLYYKIEIFMEKKFEIKLSPWPGYWLKQCEVQTRSRKMVSLSAELCFPGSGPTIPRVWYLYNRRSFSRLKCLQMNIVIIVSRSGSSEKPSEENRGKTEEWICSQRHRDRQGNFENPFRFPGRKREKTALIFLFSVFSSFFLFFPGLPFSSQWTGNLALT